MAVGGDGFRTCNISNGAIRTFDSGNDVIPLNTTGKRWYVCGVGEHCSNGQKLAIEVMSGMAAPAPSSSNQLTSHAYQMLMMAAVIAAVMI